MNKITISEDVDEGICALFSFSVSCTLFHVFTSDL